MSDTTIDNIPAFVIYDNILRQLSLHDRRNAELIIPAFKVPGQMMRQELSSKICRDVALSVLLSNHGIVSPHASNSREVSAFLTRTARLIDCFNATLPDDVRSERSAKELILEAEFDTIERILTNGPQFTLMKKMVREFRAGADDAMVTAPCTAAAGALGVGLGAALGWKALNGRELTVGYLAGTMGGALGVLGDILLRPSDYPAAWKRATAFISRIAIGMLAAKAGEQATTASSAMITTTAVVAILIAALGRFERRFY